MSKPERIPCRWVVWRKHPDSSHSSRREWLQFRDDEVLYFWSAFNALQFATENNAIYHAYKHGGRVQCVAYRVNKPGHSTRWARIQLAKGKRVRSLVTGKTVWLDPQFAYVVLIPSRNEWVTRGCMEPSEIAGRWELAE